MKWVSTTAASLLSIAFTYAGISIASWLLRYYLVPGDALDFAAAGFFRRLVAYYVPAVMTGIVGGWIGLSAALMLLRNATAKTSAILAASFFALLTVLGWMVAGGEALSVDLAGVSTARVIGILIGFWASVQDVRRDRAPN